MRFFFFLNVLFAAAALHDIAARTSGLYHSAIQAASGPLSCVDAAYRGAVTKLTKLKNKLCSKFRKTEKQVEDTLKDEVVSEDMKEQFEEFQKKLMSILENLKGFQSEEADKIAEVIESKEDELLDKVNEKVEEVRQAL
ncbi:hypothetical protein PAPHI01_2532 [Pancytospora philotis]|nr:hypothetical protein PAPHI01_2532 [Pancytospora philotis]